MKIVMLEDLAVSKEILDTYVKKYNEQGHELLLCNKTLSKDEKKSLLSDADIAIIGNGKYDAELVQSSANLRFLSVGFTGVDHLDKSIYDTSIMISNASGYATVATAELTINMMLNVLRNTVILDSLTREEKTMAGYIGNELEGKVVGIIGGGKIGIHVAKILKAFGANIIVHDIVRDEELEDLATYTTMDTLLKASDIVSLHCPLNEETKHMLDIECFEMMKDTAILINCARGLLINDDDLIYALDTNIIKGCGIDVFDMEPPLKSNHKLLHNDKIIVTPHIAYATKESMEKRIEIVFDNIDAYLNGEQINIIKSA